MFVCVCSCTLACTIWSCRHVSAVSLCFTHPNRCPGRVRRRRKRRASRRTGSATHAMTCRSLENGRRAYITRTMCFGGSNKPVFDGFAEFLVKLNYWSRDLEIASSSLCAWHNLDLRMGLGWMELPMSARCPPVTVRFPGVNSGWDETCLIIAGGVDRLQGFEILNHHIV